MHGTFFSDFPGFPGFPELVGTLSKVFVLRMNMFARFDENPAMTSRY